MALHIVPYMFRTVHPASHVDVGISSGLPGTPAKPRMFKPSSQGAGRGMWHVAAAGMPSRTNSSPFKVLPGHDLRRPMLIPALYEKAQAPE